jgi:hypothetical protein
MDNIKVTINKKPLNLKDQGFFIYDKFSQWKKKAFSMKRLSIYINLSFSYNEATYRAKPDLRLAALLL